MPTRICTRWLGGWLFGVLAFAGCAADTGGGAGGMAGAGGGMGGMAGAGGTGGTGGTGGMAGAGGTGGMAGTGGGGCIPDRGAQYAGLPNRECGDTAGCGDLEVCVDGACEGAALVFVSSRTSNAALGGPRGADEICADLAREAGLGGYWMSWTSDECTSPQKRFEKWTIEYRLLNGDQIAANWDDLIDGELDRDIKIDENGVTLTDTCKVPGETEICFVWTNTTYQGYVHLNNGCLGLTSDNSDAPPPFKWAPAQSGYWSSSQRGWSERQTIDCARDELPIYCFEQPESNQ
jgi:hypothetical protein